jgi:2,3-bisphosphoglycerate-dependent phosphoglycerate mutase
MKKQILLIRHAQSANNALPEEMRVPDPALTELGLVQAQHLAHGLARYPVSQLFCSPFRRSLDTALPASQLLDIRPSIHADIYEQGGCYSGFEAGRLRGEPGMGRAELEAAYPGWLVDPAIGVEGWNAGRKYESCEDVARRAERVATWLTEGWSPTAVGATAALIIHADFKRLLIGELLETDRWPESVQPIWNTGISVLEFDGDEWQLVEWNLVPHLPSECRSPISQ